MARKLRKIEKAKNIKRTLKKLFILLKPHILKIYFVICFAIISSLLTVIAPVYVGKMTTSIYNSYFLKIKIDYSYLKMMIVILSMLYIFISLFNYLRNKMLRYLSVNITYNLSKRINDKLYKMQISELDKKESGDVISLVINDISIINQGLYQSLSQSIVSVVTIFFVLIMMLLISWQMTIVAISVVPLISFFTLVLAKFSQPFFKKERSVLSKFNSYVEQTFSGISDIKSFVREDDYINKFEDINDVLYKNSFKSKFLSSLSMPIVFFVSTLGYVFIVIAGVYFAIEKVIEVGEILVFIQYIKSFTQPFSRLAQITGIVQSTIAAFERVFDFLDIENEKDIMGIKLKDVKGDIRFENVSFAYGKKDVLKNISFNVNVGEKVAIVGATGSGKTTLIKIILGLYEAREGNIYFDGLNIKDIDKRTIRDHVGFVPQDAWLFNDTIENNIKFGLNKTREEVVEACRISYVHNFINLMPNSYDTKIDFDNENISLGQKQLITIARAVIKNPSMIILDEATSSVDIVSEKNIIKAIDNLAYNKTSFFIAHRLDTIKKADLILVLDDGKIVESGNHLALIEKKGLYYEMYNKI